MRNVDVVASDRACDQKPRRKQETKKAGDKKREGKVVIFMSMTHNPLQFGHDAKIMTLNP